MGTGLQELCELLDTNECTSSTTTEPLPSATRTKQETNRIGATAEFGSSPAPAHFTTKTGIRLSQGHSSCWHAKLRPQANSQHSFRRSPS